MAAGVTTSTLAGLLTEAFTRDTTFAPHERKFAKFNEMTQEWPSDTPLGKGRTFGIQTKSSHSTGAASEASGVLPTPRSPEVIQANVDAVQIAASFSISELMLAVSKGEGSLGPDGVSMLVKGTTEDAVCALNRLSLGHGTGRLAVTENTTTSATQIMRNPEGTWQLRENMIVDIYDTDTGGSKQGNTLTINSIDDSTRTVVFSASLTGTAGWGVYQAQTASVSTYGVAPFGLRAWGGVTAHQRKEGRHLMEEPLVKPDRSTVAEPEISGWIEGPELTKPSLDDAAYHIKVNFHPMPSC